MSDKIFGQSVISQRRFYSHIQKYIDLDSELFVRLIFIKHVNILFRYYNLPSCVLFIIIKI